MCACVKRRTLMIQKSSVVSTHSFSSQDFFEKIRENPVARTSSGPAMTVRLWPRSIFVLTVWMSRSSWSLSSFTHPQTSCRFKSRNWQHSLLMFAYHLFDAWSLIVDTSFHPSRHCAQLRLQLLLFCFAKKKRGKKKKNGRIKIKVLRSYQP